MQNENQHKPAPIHFDFDIKHKKRPWYRDLVIFCLTFLGAWGVMYGGMNYSAFAQVAEVKAKRLKASLIQIDNIDQKTLTRVKASPQPKNILRAEKNIRPRNEAKLAFESLEVMPSDNRVALPALERNIPLIEVPTHQNWQQLEQNIQKGLQSGVVVHPISRKPGGYGNFFLTGHSSYYAWDPGRYKDVFSVLHEMEIGDEIDVYWQGQKYIYRTREIKVIKPTDVSVLEQPSDKSIVTLMTCTPIGTNKNRLIVVGELVDEL